MSKELRFDGQVVIVTGGGRGMGRSHSLMYAERGAKVVCCDNGCEMNGDGSDTTVAQLVVDEIRAAGGEAIASSQDLSTKEGCEALIDEALAAYGRVDILVHNAGICYPKPIPEITDEDLQKNYAIHFLAGLYMTQRLWPLYIEQGGGRLIYVISSAGTWGNTPFAHYGAAKMSSYALMRVANLEGKPYNIKANCIQVGAMSRMVTVLSDEVIKWFEKYMDPKGVSTTLMWMTHKDNQMSGQVINALGWHADRIVFASTPGYTRVGFTPEELLEHEDEIFATNELIITESGHDNMLEFSKLIVGAGGEPCPF